MIRDPVQFGCGQSEDQGREVRVKWMGQSVQVGVGGRLETEGYE